MLLIMWNTLKEFYVTDQTTQTQNFKYFFNGFSNFNNTSVSVDCTETYMTIKYKPENDFNGKIYMRGYSENLECFALGKGGDVVTLKIPLLAPQCGISQANSELNRYTPHLILVNRMFVFLLFQNVTIHNNDPAVQPFNTNASWPNHKSWMHIWGRHQNSHWNRRQFYTVKKCPKYYKQVSL